MSVPTETPTNPPPEQLDANVNQFDSGAGSGAPPQVVDEVDRLTQEAVHKTPLNIGAMPQGRAKWYMSRWRSMLPLIEDYEKKYKTRSDQDLRRQSLSLRYRAKAGEKLVNMLPQAFALVRESGSRTLGMRHFDVQILGGMALFHGCVAEMDTGEGKTLTATAPMYLHALKGKGSQLATVNDYLAARDAEIMRPLYELLGMSVGVIQTDMSRPQRREAYACDIIYGTAKEFGFDFLRDRLVIRKIKQEKLDFLEGVGGAAKKSEGGERPVQREPYFGLVDEADSILIDEARTPLIISAVGSEGEDSIKATYHWAAEVVHQFKEDEHYDYDHEKKKIELTARGRQLVRAVPQPVEMDGVGLIDAYDYIEQAIKVSRDFLLDQHYVVLDDEIVIVDESTGRLAEGRKWRDGIHQSIEAKEGVEITVDTGQAARITIQDLFLRYKVLAGMTGTAMTSAREFRKIYKTPVVRMPTNKPAQRKIMPDRVFASEDEKWSAIVEEVAEMHRIGRPVLIGTRTIEKSELLSNLLNQRGITHQVLNAHHVASEAEIVADAGQRNKVTVATNMAGRGTDIKLEEGIAELGGLHVICTEIHDSARIDRQLVGRCGRQGDPGSTVTYLSIDDEILKTSYGPANAKKMANRMRGTDVSNRAGVFKKAQRKVERRHLRDRMVLLHHEKQRKKMQHELGQDPYLDTPN